MAKTPRMVASAALFASPAWCADCIEKHERGEWPAELVRRADCYDPRDGSRQLCSTHWRAVVEEKP
jgi:hypothetical protein